jgi:hypothetical protein
VRAALAILVLSVLARVVAAYPQFQLSKDQTCTSCHIAPAGGLLLNENGLALAETMSTYGGAPEPAHGALVGPPWLLVGGDARAAGGLVWNRGPQPGAFPMQADFDAAARGDGLTLFAMAGVQRGSSPQTYFANREHWLMWQSNPDQDHGLYLRVGRMMPVYGLRLAEHDAYTRRFGQTPLYGETYAAAAAYIDPAWELHLTGFVHDPLQESMEHGSGAAGYGEVRLAKIAAVGLEGRYAKGDDDSRLAGGVTAKYWIAAADVLLQGEGQLIRQTFTAGGRRDQLVSYLMGTWFFKQAWMLDIGVGQFDSDLKIKNIDLECVDANVHWFATSHWELLVTNRIQTIGLGSGGATSGYALFQVHYRL